MDLNCPRDARAIPPIIPLNPIAPFISPSPKAPTPSTPSSAKTGSSASGAKPKASYTIDRPSRVIRTVEPANNLRPSTRFSTMDVSATVDGQR